jgi:hypothetical protein
MKRALGHTVTKTNLVVTTWLSTRKHISPPGQAVRFYESHHLSPCSHFVIPPLGRGMWMRFWKRKGRRYTPSKETPPDFVFRLAHGQMLFLSPHLACAYVHDVVQIETASGDLAPSIYENRYAWVSAQYPFHYSTQPAFDPPPSPGLSYCGQARIIREARHLR